MSLDRTLKLKGALRGSRSVLSRTERITRLANEGKFDLEKGNPLGLPKVKVKHSRAGTKAKKEVVSEEEAVKGEGIAEA